MRQPLSSLTRWVVAGVLAGLATATSAQRWEIQGFLYANGTFRTIVPPGAFESYGLGINDAGHIVGYSNHKAFLNAGGTFSTVEGLFPSNTFISGINNAGQMVGGNFRDVDGTVLGIAVPGSDFAIANGINDAGDIVGTWFKFISPGNTSEHGFLDVNGTVSTVDVPGAAWTQAFGINNAGHIVGFYCCNAGSTAGFLDVNGAFSTIAVPGAFFTNALGINDRGDIVGRFADNRGDHGFLYSGGTFSTVDFPGAPSWITLTGINNAGAIVGDASIFLVPESRSLVVFSVGLLGLGLAWRRKFTPLT